MNHLKKRISIKSLTKLIFTSLFITSVLFMFSCNQKTNESKKKIEKSATAEIGWQQVPSILKKINAPKFADKDFNITKYGAVLGGKKIATEAFKKAIEACNKAGGGRVVVPKGVFLTGPIHLKDNVNLHISEGAVVKFSTNPKDYLPVVHIRWEGTEAMNYSPLIYAFGKKNIAVTGSGILDGQADNQHWWPWKGKKQFGWKKGMPSQADEKGSPLLRKMNDDKIPLNKRLFGAGHYLRPTMIEFYKCDNILLKGVTLKNSPFWFVHPVLSNNITVDGIKTNSNGPNTDGFDPESCSYILVQNCVFKDGDDCIAIKSGRNNDGRKANVPSTNIVIRHNQMKDGHGGVVIGSEITGGASNIYAEDNEMSSPNLDRALRIKSNSKRGGIVKNIFMRNTTVGQVKEAIVKLNLHYDPKEAKGYHFTPEIENVFVDSVTSEKSNYALYFYGLDNSKIKNITIENCTFNGVKKGNYLNNVKDLNIQNVKINGKIYKQ